VTALIEARGLRKSFGDNVAVDGLSISVDAGRIYALVGPDGAGKTTTMRLLCGALCADEGEVWLGGIPLWETTEKARALVGYLPQRFSLYGELTVEENLRFFAEVRGLPPGEWESRAREILEFVGLAEFARRRAEALSGGMKQKLGLAAALVHRPRILLLDEPTGGVDPVTRQAFWQLLIELLGQGVGVLVSTPYMDEASRCSRVGFLAQGRLLIDGSPGEIARRLEGRMLEVVAEPRRRAAGIAADDPDVEDARPVGDRLRLRVRPGARPEVTRRLTERLPEQGCSLEQIRDSAAGLEDVFIELLQRNRQAEAQA
jgi:ABC-2 type transport system ATP-binding protein